MVPGDQVFSGRHRWKRWLNESTRLPLIYPATAKAMVAVRPGMAPTNRPAETPEKIINMTTGLAKAPRAKTKFSMTTSQ